MLIRPATPADVSADLGPATVHEQMKQNGHGDGEAKEEDDVKAMFGDLKKKKKKKEVSLDSVCPFVLHRWKDKLLTREAFSDGRWCFNSHNRTR